MWRALIYLCAPFVVWASVTNTSLCNDATIRDALAWINSQQATSGFVESFDAPSSATWAQNRGYSYDQAVAAIAHLLHAQNSSSPELTFAESILTAIKDELSFDSTGAVLVPFYWDTVTLEASSVVRSGNAAWVAEAFAMHGLLTGSTTYRSHLEGIAVYLLQRLSASGSNDCVTGGPSISWCSTEHNLDAYFALHLTYHLTNNVTYKNAANTIATTLRTSMWHATQKRFNQGINDPYRALDTQSWGSVFLLNHHAAANYSDSATRASTAMSFAEDFFATSQASDLNGNTAYGYGPYADSSNGFHANTVWSEGSAGVALAYIRMGDYAKAKDVISDLAPMIHSEGGIIYAANTTIVNLPKMCFTRIQVWLVRDGMP